MRTNEERLAALHDRAGQLKRQQTKQRFSLLCVSAGVICFGILAGLSLLIARVSGVGFDPESYGNMSASVFSGNGAMGYQVIAVLAFCLGVTVTVFCFRLKKYLDEKDRQKRE